MPLRTFRKLVWIELKLFLREPLSLAMALAFPLIVQVVMAGVFGREDSAQGFLFKAVIGIDYYTPSSMWIHLPRRMVCIWQTQSPRVRRRARSAYLVHSCHGAVR